METRLQKHHDLGGGSNYLSDKVTQQMGVQWTFLGQVELEPWEPFSRF